MSGASGAPGGGHNARERRERAASGAAGTSQDGRGGRTERKRAETFRRVKEPGERLAGKRIAGILALILWALLLLFLSGVSAKIAGMSLLIFLAAALIYDAALPVRAGCRLALPAYGEKGKGFRGWVRLQAVGVFPVLSGKIFLKAESLFTGETEIISLPVGGFGGWQKKLSFAIYPQCMGYIEVTVLSLELYGFLGLYRKKIRYGTDFSRNKSRLFSGRGTSKRVMILPKTVELWASPGAEGLAQTFPDEGTFGKKGYGAGDYYGVRPYAEGDSMKQIHWKLTGRMDSFQSDFMVKEIEVPVRRVPLLFLEMKIPASGEAGEKNPRLIDLLLEAYFSISFHMAQERRRHCLCWWDEEMGDWHFHYVENEAQLEEVYGILFQAQFFTRGTASIYRLAGIGHEKFSELLYVTGQRPPVRGKRFEDARPAGTDSLLREDRKAGFSGQVSSFGTDLDACFPGGVRLLYGREEKPRYENEELLPFLFAPETLGEDLNRILLADQEKWGAYENE